MIECAVIGAAGYAGIEAVRLVLGHPGLTLAIATSGQDAGKAIADVYPALAGRTSASFEHPDVDTIASRAKLAFLAVPHTAALAMAPDLLSAGMRVVDLSADFRLSDPSVYEAWYETPHTARELLAEALYGLPELGGRDEFASARLVAAPGCYPTASLLACVPAIEAGVVTSDRIVIDAKSGVSGAGRTPSAGTHYCAVDESLLPYKVAAHRHTPEIEQGLSRAAGKPMSVTFAPHLVPMNRGLLATAYLPVAGVTPVQAHAIYSERYAEEPFVHVHALGRMPATSEVRGTNRAHIGIALDERTSTLVVACAIDNLVKGAAGQAIQCANAMLGLPETDGLSTPMPVV